MDRTEWNRRYAVSELIWTAEPNRFLVQEAATLTPGRALDLACGEGRNAVWLAERGWSVTGVDFSEAAIEKAGQLAKRRGVDGRWLVEDLFEYRPPAAEFDLVLLFYLQLPAAQRRDVIQAAAAALAPGGTLLVVAHDSENLRRGHGGPQDPTVLYTADDVVADLDGALTIERAARVDRAVQTDDGRKVALDTLLRARRADCR